MDKEVRCQGYAAFVKSAHESTLCVLCLPVIGQRLVGHLSCVQEELHVLDPGKDLRCSVAHSTHLFLDKVVHAFYIPLLQARKIARCPSPQS